MHTSYYHLVIALISTAIWLYMYQDHVAAKIRNSRWWPVGWAAHLWLGGSAVCGWFTFFAVV